MKIKNNRIMINIHVAVGVCVVAAAIAMVLYLSWTSCTFFETAIVDRTIQNLETISRTESQHIERRFSDTLSELKVLAGNPAVIAQFKSGRFDQSHPGSIYRPVELTYQESMEDVSCLGCIDRNGIVKSHFPETDNMIGTDLSGDLTIQKVMQTQRPQTGFSPQTNPEEYYFFICCPVFDDDQYVGMLRASISQTSIQECLRDSYIGRTGYACIVDRNGFTVSHPDPVNIYRDIIDVTAERYPEHVFRGLFEFHSAVKSGQTGSGIFESVSATSGKIVNKIGVYRPMNVPDMNWSLAVIIEYDQISAPIAALTQNITTAAVVLILILITMGISLVRGQRQRIYALMQAKNADELKHLNRQLRKETASLRITESRLLQTNVNLEKMNMRAIELAKKAEAANIAKSEFLANMSHEIRTPMNAIIGFSELLGEEELTEIQRDYLDTISANSSNLLRLVDDILDFSRIEAGRLNLEMVECTVDDVLESVHQTMTLYAGKKGITYQVIERTQLPESLHTDPARLRQCLNNLIHNAIKFTHTGGVTVALSTEERDGQTHLRFDIEDTGIGIPEESINSIFGAFIQADGSTTRKYGGTGLGLTITRQLTDLLGGQLSVRSRVGQGTVMILTIPTVCTFDPQEHARSYMTSM